MVVSVRIFLLFEVEQYFITWISHILFIYSSGDGHLGCLHLLTVVIMLLPTLAHKYPLESLVSILLSLHPEVHWT